MAGAAAAGALLIAGAAHWGDDIARSFRGAPHRPPISGGVAGGGGVIIHSASTSQVESQLKVFVANVGDRIGATPKEARDAGLSTACGVLEIAFTEGRLPTEGEWVGIGLDAVAAAAIDVPLGSPAWRQLEKLKEEVERVVTAALGDDVLVLQGEAESVAEELACAWA